VKTEGAHSDALRYVVYTYALFVVLLVTLGAVATKLLYGTPLAMRWLTAITAWTPTYVLLLMFRKLCPDTTIREFYRAAFSERLDRRLVATTVMLQAAIFFASVSLVSAQKGVAVMSLLDLSFPSVASAVFFTLIQGATGEESGWRRYLTPVAEKRFGVIKGSLVVSLIWSLWHAPIWFLGSGYSGIALIKYIIAFATCITSVGFVMGLCYHSCRNLLVPVCIHFTLNFLGGGIYKGPMIDLVSWYAVFYALTAIGYLVVEKRKPEPARKARLVS
jgi:membrane protease YdiL (CAAX protease family)